MPFGEELQADVSYRISNFKYNSDDVRQKFTSYEKDKETGLDYAQARMYNNQHARFTAVDPLLASGKSGNPQTFNRYVYVINSPLQYVDPDGLQSGKWYDRGSELNPIYVPNSQGMVNASWKEITTKNSRGSLVYDGQGVPEGYQVRLNPYGPFDSENFVHRLVFETILGTDYDKNGWDYVLDDERFRKFMMTGTVHTAIQPHDVALLRTPFGKKRSFGGVHLPVKKGAEKSVALIKTFKFANAKLAFEHYAKHAKSVILKRKKTGLKTNPKKGGADMPMFKTLKEYKTAANQFFNKQGAGIHTKTGTNRGDLIRYDSNTGFFGVQRSDGTIRTFFKPDDGIEYYLNAN